MIDQVPDVVVIGGGVIGLTTAWYLAQRQLSVTLLEQGRCGHGASRAALGALWPPPHGTGQNIAATASPKSLGI